jgi:hypothetical protein
MARISLAVGFELFAYESGAMLHQFLVLRCESRGEVAVDIQFAHDFPAHEHRDNDLRFGFQRTGQITWVLVDIIDDDRQTAGGSRAANALIERDKSPPSCISAYARAKPSPWPA